MPVHEGGGTRLRLLTRSEYANSVADLLGTLQVPLKLPEDVSVAGFVSIGSSVVAVNGSSVSLYEEASRAATAEVFADPARWQKLVGCQPREFSDPCVISFIRRAGKRAYRRDLTEVELQRWVSVGSEAAQLPGSSAEQGLAAVTSGLLQSLNFLYRFETNAVDTSSGRLKYDRPSMATRLAFFLTGRPPSESLLAAAAAGQLDTAEGVRSAAAPLLEDSGALEQMAEFFSEISEARLVSVVEKDPNRFPTFDEALKSSMLQATQLFIKNVVLAPGADVRALFDSRRTFVDPALAPLYGRVAPSSGFAQVELGADDERTGILGQPAILAGHSRPDHTSPSLRGTFILRRFLCETPEPPPEGVATSPPVDERDMTTRQRLERATSPEPCAGCHAEFDPLGFALEHLDPIGRYRATEDGLPLDTSGTLDGVPYDGQPELANALRENPRVMACMMTNLYQHANARVSSEASARDVDAMLQSLKSHDYVWRELVAEFVASDAFRSAPLAAVERKP